MQQNALRSTKKMNHKIISVSIKRQLTIPQKFFDALGFSNEAECILHEDGLFIRPVPLTGSGEFSEQILADLISQGYEGQTLLEKFKEYSKAIKPAVLKLLQDNETFAQSGEGRIPMNELFGAEE